MKVRPKTRKITRASTHIFLFAAFMFNLALLVTVIKRSSTLFVSLRKVEIIKSLLRKHGIVAAIAVRMKIFIEKYKSVPFK